MLNFFKFNTLCAYLNNVSPNPKLFITFEDCFFITKKVFILVRRAFLNPYLNSFSFTWLIYNFSRSVKFSNFYFRTTSFYFQVFIDREQPRYLLLNSNTRLLNFFSTGFILRLYGIFAKYFRRMSERHSSVILFFLKFFKKKLYNSSGAFVLKGYKRKYMYFINLLLTKLVIGNFNYIYLFPQLRMNLYFFRRVKPIKKRIKKKINRIQKKYV